MLKIKKLSSLSALFGGVLVAALAMSAPGMSQAATDAKAVVKKASSHPARKVKAHRVARVTKAAKVQAEAPSAPSMGQLSGLHKAEDPLALKSSVALVVDQDTNEVLFSKNPEAVLPIASITKLMTAVVVNEAHSPLDEVLTITQDDVDTEKGTHSRLTVGTQLTRGEMLHLALMSSENRAAHALGRSHPGGLDAFVAAMNAKAQVIGMTETHYVEPTGLSSKNQSSARDLAMLVKVAYDFPLIRELSTSRERKVAIGRRQVQFQTTNGLVRSKQWDIGLQKTGYIAEAGRCLVMSAQMAGRKLIMVLLDSSGKYSRIGDAERIRKWISAGNGVSAAPRHSGSRIAAAD